MANGVKDAQKLIRLQVQIEAIYGNFLLISLTKNGESTSYWDFSSSDILTKCLRMIEERCETTNYSLISQRQKIALTLTLNFDRNLHICVCN